MAKKSIYANLKMTRAEAEAALEKTREALLALNEQRSDADTQSATLSAGGGSKSYTNRSVSDLDAKIAAVQLDYNTLLWRLGETAERPGAVIKTIVPRYCK